MQTLRDILDRGLIFWLCLSCALTLFLGQNSTQAVSTLKALSDLTMTPAIFIAMFCIGYLLPREELIQVVKQWPSVLLGTLTQYLSMPLLAFLVANLLKLEGPFYVGMILVGCVPGAMASNVLTLTARGNVSYSICLTTVATLLSPLCVPLGLYLFLGVSQGPKPEAVFLNLLQTVAIPVLLGFGLKCLQEQAETIGMTLAAIMANVLILWVIAIAIGLNAERLEQVTHVLVLALLCLNLCGYLAGWGAAKIFRIDVRKRRALILEIGMQNAGVGTMLALNFFQDTATAIPTATYTFGCMLTGTLLANYWYWRENALVVTKKTSANSIDTVPTTP